ncbi:diaminopropionate ammonia-lyase [Sporosarcina ureilytica]|uniref:Diaminopropionate ammonia-lyase n=1 Tax=Sporosarcina ureilytica TaxID=298596 RepID=A0A1D8JGB5_9BACL|nr:diaminopropionate ammonia-lyase [Sporosarcina ureilytica]AOV07747.1 diaminopropionate ammonia-lyase [Sporosarcina ureilytica]
MNDISWVDNRFKETKPVTQELVNFSEKEMKKVLNFHSSIPAYKITPLHSLSGLSNSLGVKQIYVKDESKRFGLNAFKGLGASYAMASYFAEKLSLDLSTINFLQLLEHVKSLPKSTFATVTAGNHGRGVAWAAKLFGQQAKVYLPKGSSTMRLKAIQEFGADAQITDMKYDDTVQHIASVAKENNWVLVQDTAWEGYEKLPLSIMQGYTTIVAEIVKQLTFREISHVILQAGVGSFAGAMAAAISHSASGSAPKIIIVEPSEADCLYQSAQSTTGEPQRVYGNLSTMMAGLACGEPNPIGWEILKTTSDYFFSCDDSISAKGMRVLSSPVPHDVKIISGESGAVPLGLLHELMTNDQLNEIKTSLGLDDSSSILMINTEGDTDPVNYKTIIQNT